MIEYVTEQNLLEYEDFIKNHAKGHFMQSRLWAKQKPEWRWKAIVVRDESGVIEGSLAVLIRRVPGLPLSLMYGCRGPVCDIHNGDVLRRLVEGAAQIAKKHRCYAFKLDPDVSASDAEFLSLMTGLGFKLTAEGRNFEGIQPRFVFRLNLEGKDETSLMESFESKTRYNVRLAQRKGVIVRICGHEATPDFARLMKETGLRDGFLTRPQSYFDAMLDNLGEHCRLYMAYYGELPVAGTLAVCYGDKVWYLYGASANEYRNIMPNYLLQWNMLLWALEKGCRVYDFRGVSGDISESNPLYGLYRFKKGFGGDFCEFVGELDMIYNKFLHYSIHKAERIFRKSRNMLYQFRNRK